MGYRDDLSAAHLRARTLEDEIERLGASSAANAAELARLERELDRARAEIASLAAYAPEAPARRAAPYVRVIFAGLGLVVATAVGGYESERFGVTMSYFAAAVLGAGLVGALAARHSRGAGIAGALGGGIGALALLGVFYAAVWPSL